MSITHEQRRWFFRRLADRLEAFPCGGWELAATYEGVGVGVSDDDHAGLLRDIACAVVPASERATHELVDWCRVNGLGEEVAAAVCRARGEAWTGKAGLPAEATGTAVELGEALGSGDRRAAADSGRVPGACGKAAYWLSRGGGGVRLERLCAEVSERLMVEVSRRRTAGVDDDVEVRRVGFPGTHTVAWASAGGFLQVGLRLCCSIGAELAGLVDSPCFYVQRLTCHCELIC